MSEDPTQNFPASQDTTLTQVLTAVQDLSGRIDRMETSLTGLEKKVDERLYDTRPIWEKVQADIAQVQEGQRRLEEGQESLRKEVREVRTELRDLNRKFSIVNDNLIQVQADYRDIYDRVRDLERQTP